MSHQPSKPLRTWLIDAGVYAEIVDEMVTILDEEEVCTSDDLFFLENQQLCFEECFGTWSSEIREALRLTHPSHGSAQSIKKKTASVLPASCSGDPLTLWLQGVIRLCESELADSMQQLEAAGVRCVDDICYIFDERVLRACFPWQDRLEAVSRSLERRKVVAQWRPPHRRGWSASPSRASPSAVHNGLLSANIPELTAEVNAYIALKRETAAASAADATASAAAAANTANASNLPPPATTTPTAPPPGWRVEREMPTNAEVLTRLLAAGYQRTNPLAPPPPPPRPLPRAPPRALPRALSPPPLPSPSSPSPRAPLGSLTLPSRRDFREAVVASSGAVANRPCASATYNARFGAWRLLCGHDSFDGPSLLDLDADCLLRVTEVGLLPGARRWLDELQNLAGSRRCIRRCLLTLSLTCKQLHDLYRPRVAALRARHAARLECLRPLCRSLGTTLANVLAADAALWLSRRSSARRLAHRVTSCHVRPRQWPRHEATEDATTLCTNVATGSCCGLKAPYDGVQTPREAYRFLFAGEEAAAGSASFARGSREVESDPSPQTERRPSPPRTRGVPLLCAPCCRQRAGLGTEWEAVGTEWEALLRAEEWERDWGEATSETEDETMPHLNGFVADLNWSGYALSSEVRPASRPRNSHFLAYSFRAGPEVLLGRNITQVRRAEREAGHKVQGPRWPRFGDSPLRAAHLLSDMLASMMLVHLMALDLTRSGLGDEGMMYAHLPPSPATPHHPPPFPPPPAIPAISRHLPRAGARPCSDP